MIATRSLLARGRLAPRRSNSTANDLAQFKEGATSRKAVAPLCPGDTRFLGSFNRTLGIGEPKLVCFS